ncbi:MAG: HD domain-containing protein, partial [Pseudomonas sagittaria]|nr:HD domain-containing protein [Pseudomonas sagittaria]
EVQRRMRQVLEVQDVTIEMMASLAETRDNETGNHIRRTQNYVRTLARHLQQHPRFSAFLTDTHIELLFKSAPLHDIGKIGIPDSILLKPGRLDQHEFDVMKTHAALGAEAIARAEQHAGREIPFLRIAKEIAHSHHEKWDGSGYPQGLIGDEIPVAARLMAIADVYDALISSRVYKAPMSHEEATKIISAGRGCHFDPDMVDAFLELQEAFQQIAARYADHPEPVALDTSEACA